MGYTQDYCNGCGKSIDVSNKTYNRNKKIGHKNYCCKKCFNAYRKRIAVMNVKCSICGKKIERYKNSVNKNNKYFCRDCRGMIETTCAICGKTVIRSKHDVRKYKRLFCSEECRAIGSLKEWTDVSRSMMKDHWIRVFGIKELYCRRCAHNKIYNIVLHHIKYVCRGGKNDPENLEPLCKNCHGDEHHANGIDTGEVYQPLKLATPPELIREIK